MGNTPDVVICGAGAAGLTLAIELARRGVAFRLVEQREHPFHGSRGKGIQPRSQEVFEDMGIVDQLFAAGGLYPVSRSHHADGTHMDAAVIEAAPASPAEPYRQPLMVPQFLTESVMRDRLAELGHRVDFGHGLIGVEQDDTGVSVRLATPTGEQTVRTRYCGEPCQIRMDWFRADYGGYRLPRQDAGRARGGGRHRAARAATRRLAHVQPGRHGATDLSVPTHGNTPVPTAGAGPAGGRGGPLGRWPRCHGACADRSP